MKLITAFAAIAATALLAACGSTETKPAAAAAKCGAYADVNGLHMYYEVHGTPTAQRRTVPIARAWQRFAPMAAGLAATQNSTKPSMTSSTNSSGGRAPERLSCCENDSDILMNGPCFSSFSTPMSSRSVSG